MVKSYRVVSPNDDADDFKNHDQRKMLIKELKAELLSRLSAIECQQECFATDLPHSLLEFFKKNIMSNVLHAKGFQTSALIQDKVHELVMSLLGSWQGPRVQSLLSELEQ